jgi:hypothetical protein
MSIQYLECLVDSLALPSLTCSFQVVYNPIVLTHMEIVEKVTLMDTLVAYFSIDGATLKTVDNSIIGRPQLGHRLAKILIDKQFLHVDIPNYRSPPFLRKIP